MTDRIIKRSLPPECKWCKEKVGPLNLIANIGLLGIKLIGGILGHSQALIADALHSVGDVIMSILVLVGLNITGDPPDDEHRWGHGHIEFIVAAIIGMLLIGLSILITVTSFLSVVRGEVDNPSLLAGWAALISICTNEFLFRQSICIGNKSSSPAMIANAWEKRADVVSSIAAFIGVLGARMGISVLDPVAAVIVGIMIARSGVDALKSAVHGVTDRACDEDILHDIRKIIKQEKQIKSISRMRSRKIGQNNWVDLEVKMAPDLKVIDVRMITSRVKDRIEEEVEGIGGVHIIPRVES
ncbi:MAG: cation transporter [Candidatus Omnitrophica bacterium]|nr:cation transporter [Candidatus Omnitrophota bacterium]